MKRLFAAMLFTALFGLVALALPQPAYAQTFNLGCDGLVDCLQQGACLGLDPADCPPVGDAAARIDQIIRMIINLISLIVGVVAVIMIIVGGFKYITSGGDTGNINSAKNTILYAIVGLIIVALAQVLVRFVLQQVTDF